MSNVPRDPRQLARDILAGKISIEELAREQQRRRAGGQAPQQPGSTGRVPLPRIPPPATLRQPPRPAVRQQPSIPQRQPSPFPQRQPQAQPQRPRPVSTAVVLNQRQTDALQPMPQLTQTEGTAAASLRAAESQQPAKEALLKPPAPVSRPAITRLFANRASIRQGIIIMEVLGKPLGLRDEF